LVAISVTTTIAFATTEAHNKQPWGHDHELIDAWKEVRTVEKPLNNR
jgi:hypothetical protein